MVQELAVLILGAALSVGAVEAAPFINMETTGSRVVAQAVDDAGEGTKTTTAGLAALEAEKAEGQEKAVAVAADESSAEVIRGAVAVEEDLKADTGSDQQEGSTLRDALPEAGNEDARPVEEAVSLAAAKTIPPTEFELTLRGRLRVVASAFTAGRFLAIPLSDDTTGGAPYVGLSDGLALGAARLDVGGAFGDDLEIKLGFDGAFVSYDDPTSPVGRLRMGLKDAYIRYRIAGAASVLIGRFKPPFDVEALTSMGSQQFVHASLESRGVARHEGFHADVHGFAPGRQLGVMVSDPVFATLGAMDFGYAVALTNGNGGDASLNDNDLPALWARATTAWGVSESGGRDDEGPMTYHRMRQGGVLGLSVFGNEKTSGAAPDLFDDRVLGAGFDIGLSYYGFGFQGQFLWTLTQHLQEVRSYDEHALGGHAQLSWRVFDSGFELAYRFAYYDPRYLLDEEMTAELVSYDQLAHHTVGARYVAPNLPLIAFAEYTHSAEADARDISNDRLELAIQVEF